MALFDFKKKDSCQYLLLSPTASGSSLLGDEPPVDWEILSQEDLDTKVEQNDLSADSRLFVVEREVKIHLKKTTHLE